MKAYRAAWRVLDLLCNRQFGDMVGTRSRGSCASWLELTTNPDHNDMRRRAVSRDTSIGPHPGRRQYRTDRPYLTSEGSALLTKTQRGRTCGAKPTARIETR
jgi:hypothetical protein